MTDRVIKLDSLRKLCDLLERCHDQLDENGDCNEAEPVLEQAVVIAKFGPRGLRSKVNGALVAVMGEDDEAEACPRCGTTCPCASILTDNPLEAVRVALGTCGRGTRKAGARGTGNVRSMKKGGIKRRSPFKARRTAIRKKNQKRARMRYERDFGAKAEFIRRFRCCVSGELPVEVVHVRSRGAGGTSRDAVPMAARLHRELHAIGIRTFEAKYEIDLRALAADLEAKYTREITLYKRELAD